jgi:hypothetical protein
MSDLNKLRELAGLPEKSKTKLDEGVVGGFQGIQDTVAYREQTDMDRWMAIVLAEEADTKTCPECHGKGTKKYPHEGEMETDSCRTCDGKKTVAASYKESAELTESVVGDLQNGYDRHHKMTKDYSDAFPTGADSNVVDTAGPASAKQGDNPMQKAIKQEDDLKESTGIHADLVYEYRQYKKGLVEGK